MHRRLKPRLRPESFALLAQINDYVVRYDIRGVRALASAASDVLDGGVLREEVDALVRSRLLSIERYDDRRDPISCLCGTWWSVLLTERAMRLFWSDRMALPAARANKAA